MQFKGLILLINATKFYGEKEQGIKYSEIIYDRISTQTRIRNKLLELPQEGGILKIGEEFFIIIYYI